ncbi:acyl-CoA dehydrogenase family protein [Micromonospora sp. CPCC 205561]|uniref:acyl-CoA dehydrogenase family protein n=1 Tax=Micromonospora sp. CPCC 205561 TaxID=3122407 RepID=UPI002FEFF003
MTLTANAVDLGITPATLIERATAMAPELIARQQETEDRTYYAEDTHRAFRDAGFYRVTVPKRFGGYEFDFEVFLRIAQILTRACPSTGWMYCLGAAHSLVAGTLFDEQAQADMFAGGDFIAPAPIAPGGTARRDPDGGWILDGTWRYCSGAPYATHLIGHALVDDGDGGPPQPLLFVAPRDRWEMLDDWGGQLGLKGSGSQSIRMSGARIPEYFGRLGVHLGEVSVTGGTPGRDLHENAQYGGAPGSSMGLEGAVIALGMAQGALDAYTELMFSQKTMFPPFPARVQDPDYQLWYGRASGLIDTAETTVFAAARRWHELCARPAEEFTLEEDLRLALICREAAQLCWRAVEEILQPTAGSAAIRAGTRLERVWRDLSTMHTHNAFAVAMTTAIPRLFTQARLGGGAR